MSKETDEFFRRGVKYGFRAWDKKRKRMFAVITLNASGAVSVFIDDDGLYLLPAEQIELMQYTGLKDVNGTEIAEGDILEDGEGEPIEYWVVKFEDGKFIGETQWVSEDIFELTDLEVVGNVHENLELLGDGENE